MIRFWFDRGVDGLGWMRRPRWARKPGCRTPDTSRAPRSRQSEWVDNPHWDVDSLHDVLRRWRKIGDRYSGPRSSSARRSSAAPERLSRYVRPDEMHTTFNFDYLKAGWSAPRMQRRSSTARCRRSRPVGAPATWVLSSHDETRHLTRFGRAATGAAVWVSIAGPRRIWRSVPGEHGRRRCSPSPCPAARTSIRARSSGCPRWRTCPAVLQDPTWERSGRTLEGRDGCRVPMPWSGTAPPFGFSAAGVSRGCRNQRTGIG